MTALTDRMRTCAARLLDRKAAGDPWAVELVALDATDLLIEASNVLDEATPAELGEPMPIFPPVTRQAAPMPPPPEARGASITGENPLPKTGIRPRTCPKCDSRAAKRARVEGNTVMLICPACAAKWPYVSDGKWV